MTDKTVSPNTSADVVSPVFSAGGNAKVTTTATTAYTPFAAQDCKRAVIVNNTSDEVQVQQDGAGEYFPIPSGQFAEFYGIDNLAQLGVRMKTPAATDIYARWEW
jgi:hypothetical protein